MKPVFIILSPGVERQLRKQEAASTSHLALMGGEERTTGLAQCLSYWMGKGCFVIWRPCFQFHFIVKKPCTKLLRLQQAHAPYSPESISYSICSYTGSTQAKDCQELARNSGAGEGKESQPDRASSSELCSRRWLC